MRSIELVVLLAALFLVTPDATAKPSVDRVNSPRSSVAATNAKEACASIAKALENSTASGVFFPREYLLFTKLIYITFRAAITSNSAFFDPSQTQSRPIMKQTYCIT